MIIPLFKDEIDSAHNTQGSKEVVPAQRFMHIENREGYKDGKSNNFLKDF